MKRVQTLYSGAAYLTPCSKAIELKTEGAYIALPHWGEQLPLYHIAATLLNFKKLLFPTFPSLSTSPPPPTHTPYHLWFPQISYHTLQQVLVRMLQQQIVRTLAYSCNCLSFPSLPYYIQYILLRSGLSIYELKFSDGMPTFRQIVT